LRHTAWDKTYETTPFIERTLRILTKAQFELLVAVLSPLFPC